MRNQRNRPVRLTFRLELDQLWIATAGKKECSGIKLLAKKLKRATDKQLVVAENTQKIPMSNISDIVSEPIENHEEYWIIGLRLGPTEQSRYWIYWVPAQYVQAIRMAILG
jgi:hypothetical protein